MSRIPAGLVALAAAAFVFAAWPADAQTDKAATTPAKAKKQRAVARYPGTVFVSRDEFGRTRTRIIVQRRSYLDAGTEVLPGERKFTDYAIPPGYSAFDVLGPNQGPRRSPLPSLWDLPGIGLSF
jgi:hypothetical protein